MSEDVKTEPNTTTDDAATCKCGKPSPGLGSCPYASEIDHVDDQEYCNCCDDCHYQCAMDI